MKRPLHTMLVALAVTLTIAAPVAADVQLVLKDGRVLDGTDVWREQGIYYLRDKGGGVVPIPEALVERVGLVELAEPPPEGPTGIQVAPPQQLAGQPNDVPHPAQQLAAFGEPARFQRGVIDPNWHPESDWDSNPNDPSRNDFAPSEWADSIVDTDWHPESAFDEDHTQFAPSTWQKGVVDSTWVPQDGFAKR
jgi:hypothetical protein